MSKAIKKKDKDTERIANELARMEKTNRMVQDDRVWERQNDNEG